MVRRVLWFGAALLVAHTASAQLPGGGMGSIGGGRRGGMGGMGAMGGMERVGREQNMKFPTAKALQAYNPASLLLDKHKKLKLTDAQQEQMKALRPTPRDPLPRPQSPRASQTSSRPSTWRDG